MMTLPKALMCLTTVGAAALTALAGEALSIVPSDEPSMAQRWAAKQTCSAEALVPSGMQCALESYCSQFPDPAEKRRELVTKIELSGLCFSADSTPEQMENILRRYDLLPPGMLMDPNFDGDVSRYITSSPVWTGNGSQTSSGQASKTTLTYSFPNDGVLWGDPSAAQLPNDLSAKLKAQHGVANLDKGREYFRQSFASWRRYSSLTYTESVDDNTAMSNSATHSNNRGDVRIGSVVQDGGGGVLAYNFFPSGGADMTLDSGDFISADFNNTASNYRFLRNVVAHEHGHGLGFIHPVPCDGTKLMEPFINTNFDGTQTTDKRGAQRNYGDIYAGNNSVGTAKDFGNLTTPILSSIVARDLSTNGSAGANSTNQDWFKFTLSSPQAVVITVVPTGGVYTEGAQSSGCSGTTASVNAVAAGNLNVDLRTGDGATDLFPAAGKSAAAGSTETINAGTLAAGTYAVKVIDVGPNASANQFIQTYDLTIRVASSVAPPQAVAGVNKRIGQGLPCFFMGDINSRALEAGASITSYAWDLDANGTFETAGAQVNTIYNTVGVRNVVLRVTDSNGRTATDTIAVEVFDNTPPPPPSAFNLLLPANGSNVIVNNPTLDWSDSANFDAYEVTLDNDSNFSSPIFTLQVPNSQLSLTPGTVSVGNTYYWKVVALSGFGNVASTPAVFSFNVTTPPPPCPADFNGDQTINTADLTTVLAFFGTSVPNGTNGDVNGDGFVNTADLTDLLGVFGTNCP